MANFEKLYVELYSAVNDALEHLLQGEQEEAVICLLEGQTKTIKEIFS